MYKKCINSDASCESSESTESEEEYPELLGYRNRQTPLRQGTSRIDPVQILSFGHQRFTFVVSNQVLTCAV